MTARGVQPRREPHKLVREFLSLISHRRIGLGAIAERAGYHKTTIHKWKSGVYGPGLEAFSDMCESEGIEIVLRRRGR